MKKIKLILVAIILIATSCKGQKESEPTFKMYAENEVDIKVNDNVRNALKYLANYAISISSNCDSTKKRE